MTGAELMLMGLRLHLPAFDQDFRGEVEMLVPGAAGQLDDLLPLVESLIKEGHSHLRPWIACARQLEQAAIASQDEVRSFMADVYERARSLGWTPDQDLFIWLREHGGFEPQTAATDRPAATDAGWA